MGALSCRCWVNQHPVVEGPDPMSRKNNGAQWLDGEGNLYLISQTFILILFNHAKAEATLT